MLTIPNRRIIDESTITTEETAVTIHVEVWETDNVDMPNIVGITTTTSSNRTNRCLSQTTMTADHWDELR